MFSYNIGGITKSWIEGCYERCSVGGFLLLWLSKEITAKDGMDAPTFTFQKRAAVT